MGEHKLPKTEKQYSNPNVGNEVRIEQDGLEVSLVFVASSIEKADALVTNILNQLKTGALNLKLVGTPTSITEV